MNKFTRSTNAVLAVGSIWIPSLDESSAFFHQLRLRLFTRIRRPLQDKGEERRPVSYMTQTAVSNWAS
jgi:hypothetical protein